MRRGRRNVNTGMTVMTRVISEIHGPVCDRTGPLYILGKCINRSQSGHGRRTLAVSATLAHTNSPEHTRERSRYSTELRNEMSEGRLGSDAGRDQARRAVPRQRY